MYISVVVLTCNQQQLTLRCLKSLESFINDSDCELILVDNGSIDGTSEVVRSAFSRVRIIELSENRGVAGGRNVGLKACTGDYMMILDNDTVADRETIYGLAEYLKHHPDVGLVAPRLVSPQGEIQQSFKKYPGVREKILNVVCRRTRTTTNAVPTMPIEPFYVIGAAQMFSREVYNIAGPLDEKIFFGPEDADFCMSVRSMGKKVVYNPSLTIVHDWQRSSSRHPLSRQSRRHALGLLHFYIKHRRFW